MADKVLCVDDDAPLLNLYRALGNQLREMGRQFVLETAQGGRLALAAVAGNGPYAVVISDMQMPDMDGIQFLRRVKEIAPNTVRMMLTGAATLQVATEALHEGSIFRFLTKPCAVALFDKAIAAGIEQYRLITAEKELLEKTLTGCIDVLTEVLSVVNPLAFGRASRVRHLVKQLRAQLKADTPWHLELAAMLSQFGCVTVPEQILRRVYRGAELTAGEQQAYTQHPRVGHDLIAHIPRLEPVAQAIAYQDRRYDGKNAPEDDRKGPDIPFVARVLKVALDFDILTSKDFSKPDALECMKQRVGWYDPCVIEALQGIVERDTGLVLKEVSVKLLMDKLEAIHGVRCVEREVSVPQLLGRMVLAENVWTSRDILVLSKGHQITLPLLERLRNYSRNAVIREPIRVLVPRPLQARNDGPGIP